MPQGVLLLQDLKTHFSDFRHSGGGSHEHKLIKIERILSTYPNTRFVLLGDSGQKDPELYYKIAQKYPQQIAAIYIRYIKHKPSIRNYIHELNPLGIEMRLFKKSEDVLKDARKKGILV
jgi:phosphatidate phosphatase APP1